MSPSLEFGSAETEVIVRRTISLTASIPRFARVGDTFEGGTLVTVQGGCAGGACPPVVITADLLSSNALDFAKASQSTLQVDIDDG